MKRKLITMRNLNHRMIRMAALILCCAVFASGMGTPAARGEAGTPEDEWTVLFYFCGSDLESQYSYATGNLEEIARCGQPRNILNQTLLEENGFAYRAPGKVNVLIATGGSKKWHTQDLGMETRTDCLQYWRYEPGEDTGSQGTFHQEETRPLASMADPGTLTDFIQWGTSNYPAKKYCLVLWDHGGGSKTGIFIDELFEGDVMYLDELGTALANGGVHFETVLFDACLMANFETAYAIRNQASWMVASEEVVAGKGTAISEWLQQLYYLPDCDGSRLGRWICDMTAIKYANEDDEQARELMTWSVADLSKVDDMAAQVEFFFDMMCLTYQHDPRLLAQYARSVLKTDFYGSGKENMYDIASILYETIFNETCDPDTHWKMMGTVTDLITYCVHGSGRASARGLSFCYATDFTVEELEHYARNCPSPHYLALLDAISPWTAPEWVYERVERLPEINTFDEFQVKVNKIVYADGTPAFTFEEGYNTNVSMVLYNLYRKNEETGQSESLGTAGVYLDNKTEEGQTICRIYNLWHWPAVDGTICKIELLSDYFNEYYDSLINIPIQINEKVWNLRCGFSGKGMTYTVYGLWEGFDSDSSMFNRNVKTLAQFAGQEYQLLYETSVDPETGRVYYAMSEPKTMTRALSVNEVTLPEGTYEIEFVIVDLFNRDMTMDRIGMEWDGEQMRISTDGWEGTETLTVDDVYARMP